MPIKIITVPCLVDNYAFILHDVLSKKTTLIDAPEFNTINLVLEKENWGLDNILITHHHDDHVGGVKKLVNKYNPTVFGADADKHRLPPLDVLLFDRDKFSASNLVFKTMEVSGHTIGHLAFYCASEKIVFTGDSLMSLGCGRLFEGTAEQMYESLNSLAKLPDDTIVYSGHEYAYQNALFALNVDPQNSELINKQKLIKRNLSKQVPNVPTSIGEEKKINPFLRSEQSSIKQTIGLGKSSDLEVFTLLRKMKDEF